MRNGAVWSGSCARVQSSASPASSTLERGIALPFLLLTMALPQVPKNTPAGDPWRLRGGSGTASDQRTDCPASTTTRGTLTGHRRVSKPTEENHSAGYDVTAQFFSASTGAANTASPGGISEELQIEAGRGRRHT